MIQMKWRADSENSENSALDTIIVTHKIYEKKYFLIGLTLLRRIEQLNTLLVYQLYLVYQYTSIYLDNSAEMRSAENKKEKLKH